MFKLVNRYGNAHIIAKTERERDEYIKNGYKLEEDIKPKSAAANSKPKVKQNKK